MRIVIDMQGAQSASRLRGIGNYTRSLVASLANQAKQHELILCVNGMLAEGADDIRKQFGPILGNDHILEWRGLPEVVGWSPERSIRRRASEIMRERFLQSLSGDCLLVSSHFEGFVDDAVTSIGHTSSSQPCSVIAYDLIPALNRAVYLRDPVYRAFYEDKLEQFSRADQFLCISESTREEVISVIKPPESKLNVIHAGVGAAFENVRRQDALQGAGRRLGKYILYPGGLDERKNLRRLIEAFSFLPHSVQREYKILILGHIEPADKEKIFRWASDSNLSIDRIVTVGFVPEAALVSFYTCAKLVVFPSLHEGFGLPLLEAMKCETPVIGADAPGIREIAAVSPGLFDPHDTAALASMMKKALLDEGFRAELNAAGKQTLEKYSWSNSAQRTLEALTCLDRPLRVAQITTKRPSLAYISPLPPERTGIADYSAELIPALSQHYDIVCVVEQPDAASTDLAGGLRVISTKDFSANAQSYDRILYHFGNSPFHTHMFDLLRRYPGVVVLHDQFFGSFLRHAENHLGWSYGFWRALYSSHGWTPVISRAQISDDAAINSWPASREIISRALGIITHSQTARHIAEEIYGEAYGSRWRKVNFPKAALSCEASVRSSKQRKFRISTFGFIDDVKCPIELVESWALSPMSKRNDCELIFIGENEGGEFGRRLNGRIADLGLEQSVRITGFVDATSYREALRNTDVAIQLRKVTRGETSAAVFDCLAAGIPLVVNKLGAMNELPEDIVLQTPEVVTPEHLSEVLTQLWQSPDQRKELGKKAAEYIEKCHSPAFVADEMKSALESFYAGNGRMYGLTLKDLQKYTGSLASDFPDALREIAFSSAINHRMLSHQKTLYVDISAIVATKKLTGVERTSRSILDQLLRSPPPGFRVEPVFATTHQTYRTASVYVCAEYGIPGGCITESEIHPNPGDVLFILDWQPEISKAHRAERARLKSKGVRIIFFVYDLLPIVSPQWFPDFVHTAQSEWMYCIAESDGAICISRAVAHDLQRELADTKYGISQEFSIGWSHLGSDIPHAVENWEHSDSNEQPFVLMVGTVEPRKGHQKVLDALQHAWAKGETMRLVVVGGAGWMVDGLIARLTHLAKTESRFTWLQHADDKQLVSLYQACQGLIMASEGEGFGLPIIEAARYNKPLLVRDIPVFREICGDYATYFVDDAPLPLANAMEGWFANISKGRPGQREGIPIISWLECSRTILSMIEDDRHPNWLERNPHSGEFSAHTVKAEL
ncbi:putative mannosyltransferase [Hyphomonas neptunium ATCC 15444]|uniref:Putative mannosyltransferase n=2 Tax=Hyphomonas TaxID=85 RepID=Q0C412_HYPNA|nr:putative mannosyltransferase [Hyphomonas neptunium ATCC 15444]